MPENRPELTPEEQPTTPNLTPDDQKSEDLPVETASEALLPETLSPSEKEPEEVGVSAEQENVPTSVDVGQQPEQKADEILPEPSQKDKLLYKRFRLFDRIEHWVFITSFITLAITGLVQRYFSSPISQAIMRGLGGIESTRTVHHIAAILMMLCVIYHIGAVIYKLYVRRTRLTMLPGMADFVAFWDTIKFFIGKRKNPAQQGRFTFEEKIEYFAVVWGTIIMAITGFMMWNPIMTTKFLSGQFIVAAKFAHSMEAVLAVLSILIWHFYHIFIKTFNKSMFNGNLNEHQMMHEHPVELADIKAGIAERIVDPKEKARRRRIFYPTYGVVAGLMIIGLVFFVTFEQTAIATVPPVGENVEAFAPLTPTPLPTLLPTNTPPPAAESPTWDNTIGPLFTDRCSSCHGNVGKFAELDLSTYVTTLAGGKDGPVIIPGNPAESLLISIQSAGGHPGQLTPEEIKIVNDWISAGAPEK
jgi:formate dehydrogenase gamma subunit